MSIAKFKVKYPRPKKLSDPGYDFSRTDLDKLLATPDSQMGMREYRDLLGPELPAGIYEEVIYFLPLAFRYFISHDANKLDLITAIIGFCSYAKGRLEKDKLADEVRDCLYECLAFLTHEFEVFHPIDYPRDLVRNSGIIVHAIEDLVEFKSFADVAVGFIHKLAHADDDPIKAAWFLEFACSQQTERRRIQYEPITALIHDPMLIRLAAELVSEKLASSEPVRTYWPDTFKRLSIDWALPLPDAEEKKLPYPRELKSYIDKEGRLTQWPSPTNKKGLQRMALVYLASKFEFERQYSEREVNAILKEWHTFGDHALLRRELYDKGFFDRKVDGSQYWRTEPPEG